LAEIDDIMHGYFVLPLVYASFNYVCLPD